MISVIIPVYNTKPYLAKCINSVKKQSQRNWECIVVDDGSTDGSTDDLFNLTKSDKRFTIVAKSRNEGLPSARNTGMQWAKGEYLFFLDSDDWIQHDAFDCLLGEASVHPNVGSIIGNYIEYLPGRVFGHYIEPAGLLLPEDPHPFASGECDLGHATGRLYIRRNLPDIEFPKVKIFEDMIFNMGLIFAGVSTFSMRKFIYNYNRREASLLSQTLSMQDAEQTRDALAGLADRFNPNPETYNRFQLFLEKALKGRIKDE